ncbi:MAG TPA: metal ABC transporter permease [Candidatus Binatia bacterium]|nr:metal ABC transporter permease [Candidatus Binatia bacterium]
MFSEPFMQRALIAALCLGPLCAFLGVFVTARRMAFFSDTISHGALAGVAIGLWLGFPDPTIALIGVSLLVAGAIFWLKEKTDLLTDTIMALLLSGSVALGIIILSLLKRRPGDIHNYLFGDIFAIRWWEVGLIPALVLVVGVGLFLMLNRVSLITVHEDLAHVSGVPVRFMNFLFIVVLTLTVAVTIRLLGIILVTALIVVPPAAARNLSRNLRQQIVLSFVFGLLGALGGTGLSYQLNLPCGPAIVMTCIVLFIISLLPRTALRPRPV